MQSVIILLWQTNIKNSGAVILYGGTNQILNRCATVNDTIIGKLKSVHLCSRSPCALCPVPLVSTRAVAVNPTLLCSL